MRIVVLKRQQDGVWVAEVPSLPGCVRQHQSKLEVVQQIQQDIHDWIESAQAQNQPIPEEDYEIHIAI